MNLTAPTAQLILHAEAQGQIVHCTEGLSFWGGVDPATGVIIDAHHPDRGTSLAGAFVLMATSRGSCSGSGVLLELALRSRAPAALVFREHEDILTLGAIIASQLFDVPIAVLRLPAELFDALAGASHARIGDGELCFGNMRVAMSPLSHDAVSLSTQEQRMLDGKEGLATQTAMQVIVMMAVVRGAENLVNVSRGHIDGCILAHEANLVFAETMQRMGAQVRIPTTINAISVDRENWLLQGVARDFGNRASRLADAYVAMGARSTFTCAPYLLAEPPAAQETIGWSESNAVIYANSVLGARTEKHPDYLDLFIAMTGRAPNTGVYLQENRRADRIIAVALPQDFDDSLWPMLGWLSGMLSPAGIPLLTGLESAQPDADNLKALCAAFGTTSAAPLLHVNGHTPEAQLTPRAGAPTSHITTKDLLQVWKRFNRAQGRVDLVAIGSPHASLTECRKIHALIAGRRCQTPMILTIGRSIYDTARKEGLIDGLVSAGVQLVQDLCWCSITEPVFPANTRMLMTNSGKYAHYAPGLSACEVRFGSLEDCVQAALTGQARPTPPAWLNDT